MNEPSISRTDIWRDRLKRMRARGRSALPFISGVLATLVALLIYNALTPAPRQLTARDVNDTVAEALASATKPPAYSTLVYQAIQPSIVYIETQSRGRGDRSQDGVGTGVIVNENGDILTSLHVVSGSTTITLTFADGSKSTAEVIAQQPEIDIAVLQANTPPALIIPATLGNPRAMRIGDEVFAVGNPLGLYSSMSAGVVSGLDRSFRPRDSSQRLEGLIQIDAAVNPGNSGGPLLNRAGQVVGIVTALVNPTGDEVFIGIGFAVPINVAGAAAGLPPY